MADCAPTFFRSGRAEPKKNGDLRQVPQIAMSPVAPIWGMPSLWPSPRYQRLGMKLPQRR
jgi:hypothetical protein